MRPIEYRGLGQHGRLGNQLWQIAASVGVARILGRPVQVAPGWQYRAFFSLPDEWYGDGPSEHVAKRIDPNPWIARYCQVPFLWEHCADEIREAFAPSARAHAVLDSLPQPGPMDVAVHVRRTDYLDMTEHLPALPAHWYRRAIGPLVTLLGWKHAHELRLHVYGDDPEWAQAELCSTPERHPNANPSEPTWTVRGYGSEDADEITDWCDLLMMARYRHHIIANSSYSWWAAWLSGDDHAVVPDPWYGPKIDVSSPALLSWPKVPRTRPDRWDSERQEWIEMPE